MQIMKPLTPLSNEDFFPFVDDLNSTDSLNPFSSVDMGFSESSLFQEPFPQRENIPSTDPLSLDRNERTPISPFPSLIHPTFPSFPNSNSLSFQSSLFTTLPTSPVQSFTVNHNPIIFPSTPISLPASPSSGDQKMPQSPSTSPGTSGRYLSTTDISGDSAPSPSPYNKIRTPKTHVSPSTAGDLTVDAEIRRRKHNQAEKRRRNKIKETFKELASLVECSRTQKSTILRVTIDKVQSLQHRIKNLKLENDELRRANEAQQRKLQLVTSPTPPHRTVSVPGNTSTPTSVSSSLLPASSFLESDTKKLPSKTNTKNTTTATPIVSNERFITPNVGYLFFNSGIPMLITALSGKIIDCNELFASLLGYSREFLLKADTTTFQITHPDSLATSFVLVSNLLTHPTRSQRIRKRYITKTGLIWPTEMVCWISSNQTGQPEYINAIVEPVEEEDSILDD